MHDHFILVEGRVGRLFDDVVHDSLVVGAGVEKAQTVKSSSVGVMVDSITCIGLRQKLVKVSLVVSVFEDEAKGSDGGELVPMCALGSPFQVLFDFQEGVVLSVGLQHGESKDGRPVGDGVFAFYFLFSR